MDHPQNLVLVSGCIKYGKDNIVRINQKSKSYWGKIAKYCIEYCSCVEIISTTSTKYWENGLELTIMLSQCNKADGRRIM